MNTDEEAIAKRRRMTKERKARWLARQSQELLDRIRVVDAAAYKRPRPSPRVRSPTENHEPAQGFQRGERFTVKEESAASVGSRPWTP
ncbi:hypothetical protein AVEN_203547-1 [Araneus ventricosus]|uniref:Uncharacterized protein n=1 Tax=Araneus ventricosus TaxID=182803 RepID=A0A4Y2SQ70_ARAVE|nr:hypothetical protein AVEN_203554-1 [Araneus ventricosus]GBN90458.1 hypothetical protein AVEN_203547-1 [Araneus ventricosus]